MTAAACWQSGTTQRLSAGISACTAVSRFSASRTGMRIPLSLLPLHRDRLSLIPVPSGTMMSAGRLPERCPAGRLYGRTGCRRSLTGLPAGWRLSWTCGGRFRDAVCRMQGKGDVRPPPLPDREPFPCAGCTETREQLPGEFPLGLYRELRVPGCPGRAAPDQRFRQSPGLDPANLGIDEIVGIRARTIRGSAGLQAVAGSLQEIALSSDPLDVDVYFEKPVAFSLNFDGTVAPVGLSGHGQEDGSHRECKGRAGR